jgi:hypothetical protein
MTRTYYVLLDHTGRQWVASRIERMMYDRGHLFGKRLLYVINAKRKDANPGG